jgi:hypothetical protein
MSLSPLLYQHLTCLIGPPYSVQFLLLLYSSLYLQQKDCQSVAGLIICGRELVLGAMGKSRGNMYVGAHTFDNPWEPAFISGPCVYTYLPTTPSIGLEKKKRGLK